MSAARAGPAVDVRRMGYCRSPIRASVTSAFNFEDAAPSTRQRVGAFAVCAVLVGAVLLAMSFGRGAGPQIRPFIPITATMWSLADLLTAFLLLAQFYVNGNVFFGILAIAYASTGLMTWPYLATFPGVFSLAWSDVAHEQIPIYLWSTWHALFPVIVTCAVVVDAHRGRLFARGAILLATVAMTIAPIISVAGVATILAVHCAELPHLVIAGHFLPMFKNAFLPCIILLNALACVVLLGRRRLTPLSLWLGVAMFSAALDASLNLIATAYSPAWDTGKIITVFTASVVLVMILCDIVGLYGRLARVARTDVLTALPNRRAFEEYFEIVFGNARRMRSSMGLLVVDIDYFKQFNDRHGHLGGDECLRQIAREMQTCISRPLDLIARYGGEEFVVVLPETPLAGVMVIAERLRIAIEEFDIVRDNALLGRVTLSIGIAYADNVSAVNEPELFATADRCLYDAKERGRNRVMLDRVA